METTPRNSVRQRTSRYAFVWFISVLIIFGVVSLTNPAQHVLLRRFLYQLLWWLANFVTIAGVVSVLSLSFCALIRQTGKHSKSMKRKTADTPQDGKEFVNVKNPLSLKRRILFTTFVLWATLEVLGGLILWQQSARQSKSSKSPSELCALLPKNLPRSTKGELRIAAIGGSTTKGAPFCEAKWLRFSFPHLAAWQLERRHPGLSVRVENFAKGGASLSDMVAVLKSLSVHPDILLVYSGHNEFLRLTPHWWLGWQSAPELIVDFDGIQQRVAPLSFFAWAMAYELRSTEFAVAPRQSERRLFDVPLCGEQQMDQVYQLYESTLSGIVKWCLQEDILPVLIVPASNASGIGPNRSWLPIDTPRHRRQRLKELWRKIDRSDLNTPRRLALLEQAQQIAPTFAETWYQLGKEYEARGRTKDANVAYQRAMDNDGNPHRATSRIADICNAQPANVIDARQIWRPLSSARILGDQQFYDYCHPTLQAYLVLSNSVVDVVETEMRKRVGDPIDVPPITVAEVATQFKIKKPAWQIAFQDARKEWERHALYRFDPLPARAKAKAYTEAIRRLQADTYPQKDGIPRSDVVRAIGQLR